ncbi:TonB-dependent receptor [Halalkalibaculum sp. DA384]
MLLVIPAFAQKGDDQMASADKKYGDIQLTEEIQASSLLNKIISLDLKGVTLEQALKKVSSEAELKLSYSTQLVPVQEEINLQVNQVTVNHALWKILEGTGLRFAVSPNKHLVIMNRNPKTDPQKKGVLETVSGQVVDASTNESLPGVNIILKGTSTGTSTDAEGRFELNVPSLQDTLMFSFIGYQTLEMPINGQTQLEVVMQPQAVAGEELIVTGYMQQQKADLTGSISVIESDEVEGNQYSNVSKALQGKVPGMQITTDGDPVGNAEIQIRGITSVNANPPLIVVDGMPTQLNLNDLNSGNIASIQVLKDAASASIYGSRAASGVILVETKKGQRGDTEINYRGSIGGSSIMNRPDMLNTQQYGEALWRAAINDGLDPDQQTQLYSYDWSTNSDGLAQLNSVTPREWLNPEQTMPSADTDWFDEVLQTGLRQKHQITVSTGTENSRTMFSADFFQNEGTVMHSGLDRYTVRLNTDFNLIDNVLRIGENVSLSHKTFRSGVNGSIRNMLIMPPIVPVRTNTGEWGGTSYYYGMDDYNNPVRELTIGKDNKNNQSKLVGSVFVEFSPVENLLFKTQAGMDYTDGYFRHVDYTWQEGGGKQDTQNGVSNNYYHNLDMTLTNTVNYNTTFSNYHDISLVGGIEIFKNSSQNFNAYRQDIEIENRDYAFLNTATGNLSANGSGDELSMVSYFSKVNYNFDSRYLLSATVRYDGASVFGTNSRYALFPAASVGWRLSNEEFIGDNSIISELKIRASWGVNGNSNIPTNARFNYYDADYYSTAYAIEGNQTGQLASGYRKIQTGNEDLQWEETTQFTLGVDFGFYEGKLTGSIDLYDKDTDGMLFYPPFLGAAGEGAGQWVNAADMINRGVEFQVNYMNSPSMEFDYSIGLNLSSNRNTIDNLPNSVRFAYGGNGIDDDIQGRPLNSYYGFVADGIFKSQEEVDAHAAQTGKGLGRIRYKDLNGDGEITWNDDRKWIGNSDPDLIYGVNFDSNYKNWDFTMFWQGVLGNTVRNDWKTYSDFWNVWTQAGFNHSTRVLDAWSPQNPDSDIPALSLSNANDERRLSTYFMESGAYLKLRNIELGFTIPSDVRSKIGAEDLRLFVSAQNIINIKKWWGDDAYTGPYPENATKAGEYSNPYMRPQIFSAGIDVTF